MDPLTLTLLAGAAAIFFNSQNGGNGGNSSNKVKVRQ